MPRSVVSSTAGSLADNDQVTAQLTQSLKQAEDEVVRAILQYRSLTRPCRSMPTSSQMASNAPSCRLTPGPEGMTAQQLIETLQKKAGADMV